MKSTLPNPGVLYALDQIQSIFAKAAPKLPEVKKEVLEEKEAEPKKNPFHVYPDFPFSVQRDFSDDSIEIAIEVTHYRPPGNNRGLDSRDPAYDGGDLELGAAHYLDGRECILTPLEREAAETAFWN